MVRASFVLAALAVAAAVLVTHAHAAAQPRLTLMHTRPVAVHGTGFHARESVRLVVRVPYGVRRQVARTDASGAFDATVAAAHVARCQGFSITATDADGSRAVLIRRTPECAPLQAGR